MYNILNNFLLGVGLQDRSAALATTILMFLAVLAVAVAVTWIVRNILFRAVTSFIRKNRYTWDDALVHNHLFDRLSWFVPLVIFYLALDLVMLPDKPVTAFTRRLILTGFVIVTVRCILALLNAINEIYMTVNRRHRPPIRSYIDAARIISLIMGGIFILAILTNRSPWGLLSVLGGLTAVTMLVFKDSILGFVASVQLTGTDMVRLGDWIEMPSYGADGDVTDISIHCVKVRNWDKTITTIPTYALVANSFKNWRGMAESGGRRIKRAINIDMNSIRFVTDEELEKFSRISLLGGYVKARQEEIEKHNREHEVDTSLLINGRRQTNVGIFRAYILAYLKNHPKIHRDMTFLVRHLPPGGNGLPVEIYVFSNDQAWASYESIQADIFDHLLASLPTFGLRIFQNPTGHDFSRLATHLKQS